MIIPVFIPQGGCPERCSFCNQAVSGGAPAAAGAVAERIRSHLATARAGEPAEVAFYGGTFTALSRDLQRRYLDAVVPFFGRGVGEVRVATRPDAIDGEWIRFLRDTYRLRTVELGVQSFNGAVLTALGRGHAPASVDAATATLKALGLSVGYHIMVGCPGEGDWDSEELPLLRRRLEGLRPRTLRLHPLLVLRGSPLQALYEEGRIEVLDLEQAVERCAQVYEIALDIGIDVIRSGLQPNEIMGDGGVVAGPYHPAFGDLVRSRLARRRLEPALAEALAGAPPGTVAEVLAAPGDEGPLRGHSKQNLFYFRGKFPLHEVRVSVVRSPGVPTGFYGNFQIRLLDPRRPSQRREIQPPQPLGG